MTGSSSMYASHTAGTAKAPDEHQKCTSTGRETQGWLTKPLSAKLQEMVRRDIKSWPTISSINLYTAGTTKVPAQRQYTDETSQQICRIVSPFAEIAYAAIRSAVHTTGVS